MTFVTLSIVANHESLLSDTWDVKFPVHSHSFIRFSRIWRTRGCNEQMVGGYIADMFLLLL